MIKSTALVLLIVVCAFPRVESQKTESQGAVVEGIGAKIDRYLTQATAFGFSGSALVAKDGRILLNKGYGFADRSRRIPITADTVMEIGSITKQFTAAAIMKLEMMGKLKTEDPISKYLDGVPEDKTSVTVHHLLTHTAGFPEYSGGDYDMALRDETIKQILASRPTTAPGKTYAYSNTGYSVLAAIVEKVSGQSYESFLNQYLFKPARMMSTGYVIPKWDRAALPHGYEGSKDYGTAFDHQWSPEGPYWNLFGNGGILSTTGDMYRWHLALERDDILSAEAKKKMFTPFLNNYAYGWSVNQSTYGKLIGHSGGNDVGFNAQFLRFVDSRVVVIVFSNAGEPPEIGSMSAVTRNKVVKLIFGGEMPDFPSASFSSLQPAEMKKFEGRYRLPSGSIFTVAVRDERLIIEPEGQEAVRALALAEADRSFCDESNARAIAIAERMTNNDFDALKEWTTAASFERFRSTLEQRIRSWQAMNGQLRGLKVLGTVPSWWSGDGSAATFVRADLDNGRRIFRFHWKGNMLDGIGGEVIKSPAATPLQATSANEFVGFHLGHGKTVRVRFLTRSRKVTGLTVQSGKETLSAQKVE
ncbi:MAG TPA: serine hydrolase domain-containing protein [Blastocatellia bacterium]